MQPFVHTALPGRIVFGAGVRRDVGDEVLRLGHRRALVLCTPQQVAQAHQIAAALGELAVDVFHEATMHTPVEVTERAQEVVRRSQADCVVSIGGGSTTGLGKAIAFRTDLDQVVLPTTYAGSEVTPVLGETASAKKTTQRSMKVLPETVLYDVELTTTMPVGLSVTSAINSMAHAVEALWAQDGDPVTALKARESVRTFMGALPRIVDDPADLDARGDALYGAWLAGTCLASVGMALHHKLCHVLGGSFDLPHAEVHTVVLPFVVAYNADASPEIASALASTFGDDAAGAIRELVESLGGPTSLRDLGLTEAGVDAVVQGCLESPYWNPRPVEEQSLRRLVADAWAGNAPAGDGYRLTAA